MKNCCLFSLLLFRGRNGHRTSHTLKSRVAHKYLSEQKVLGVKVVEKNKIRALCSLHFPHKS
jgi:hypothetical protein